MQKYKTEPNQTPLSECLLRCSKEEFWRYISNAWSGEYSNHSDLDPDTRRLIHLNTHNQDISKTRSRLQQLNLSIAHTYDVYPSQLYALPSIAWDSIPEAARGLSDVYKGVDLDGKYYARKRLRLTVKTLRTSKECRKHLKVNKSEL